MGISKQARHTDGIRVGLERWLKTSWPDAVGLHVCQVSRPQSGLSSETVFVEVGLREGPRSHRRSLVARLAPPGEGLFPSHDLATQAQIHSALAEAGIPVAPLISFEDDPSWLGAPFLLMERVPGRVIRTDQSYVSHGWLHNASAADQARLAEGFLDTLAKLHRVDWRAAGLGPSVPDAIGLDAALKGWTSYLDWVDDGRVPAALRRAADWCRSSMPRSEPPPSLLWGDAQLGNAVFADDLSVAAILDFELATFGPAELDLGWFLCLHGMTVASSGGLDLPGFGTKQTMVARYQHALGREIADLRWYEVFAAMRSGAILVRVATILERAGSDASWLRDANPAVAYLDDQLS